MICFTIVVFTFFAKRMATCRLIALFAPPLYFVFFTILSVCNNIYIVDLFVVTLLRLILSFIPLCIATAGGGCYPVALPVHLTEHFSARLTR